MNSKNRCYDIRFSKITALTESISYFFIYKKKAIKNI